MMHYNSLQNPSTLKPRMYLAALGGLVMAIVLLAAVAISG